MEEEILDLEKQVKQVDEELATLNENDAERRESLISARNDLVEMLEMTKELAAEEAVDGGPAEAEATTSKESSAEPSWSGPAIVDGVWQKGAPCEAKWSVDGLYYNAIVMAQVAPATTAADEAQSRVRVRFVEYNEEDVVNFSNVRERQATPPVIPPPPAAAAAAIVSEVTTIGEKRTHAEISQAASSSSSKSSSSSSSKNKYELLPIPKSLEVLPSDSAEVRERKRKKVKSIKSKNRLIKLEKEKAKKASSWQKFLTGKASSKSVTGFASSKKKKESMFRTPDSIHGKVGVIGSGQGVTSFTAASSHALKKKKKK